MERGPPIELARVSCRIGDGSERPYIDGSIGPAPVEYAGIRFGGPIQMSRPDGCFMEPEEASQVAQTKATVPQSRPRPALRSAGTRHRGQRAGWLRAAVLGANDGIVSVASVAIGVIASGAPTSFVLTAAVAALVAGAMAMAAGEYVSVSSQRDVERADLEQERRELQAHPETEKRELAAIYVNRGLSTELANQVAEALTVSDALGAHARDELGFATILARPVQAAVYSAVSFTAGAILPITAFLLVPTSARTVAVVVSALLALVLLGIAGARAGGAPILPAALRVGIGGGFAMAITAAVGRLVGGIGA